MGDFGAREAGKNFSAYTSKVYRCSSIICSGCVELLLPAAIYTFRVAGRFSSLPEVLNCSHI